MAMGVITSWLAQGRVNAHFEMKQQGANLSHRRGCVAGEGEGGG